MDQHGGPDERRGPPHPGPRRQGADPRVQPRPHADRRPLPPPLDARRRPAAAAALRGQPAGRGHLRRFTIAMAIVSRPTTAPECRPSTYVRTAEDSKELSRSPEPCIVVASGGMCDGGRIMTYLRQHIDDPRTTIVLVELPGAALAGPAAAGEGADGALPRPRLEQVGRGGGDERLLRPRRPATTSWRCWVRRLARRGRCAWSTASRTRRRRWPRACANGASPTWRRRTWRRRRRWRDERSRDRKGAGVRSRNLTPAPLRSRLRCALRHRAA